MDPDHFIMLQVKSGDVNKLSILYERYKRRLFGFFYQMSKDAATSEDLVQNVFMRILKYKHTYAEDGKFDTWAFHMARNVQYDHFRKNQRYQFNETMDNWEHELKEEETIEKKLTRKDELDHLQMALDALPDEKRELIVLTRFQQLKYAQVADMLGTTESAIKVRIHRILKELKTNYELAVKQ